MPKRACFLCALTLTCMLGPREAFPQELTRTLIGTIADEQDRTLQRPITKVRSKDLAIAAAIQEAAARSATFRGLLDAINASDGIVYVEEGDCGRAGRACLVGVTVAGPYRLIWVKVDTRRADWDLMGSIGHELRHAVEVLGNPKITSTSSMYFFYEREGHRAPVGFETKAAIQAGNRVRAEVRRVEIRHSAPAVRRGDLASFCAYTE